MKDPRYAKLADVMVGYSTKVSDGDRVLIECTDVPPEFTTELVRRVRVAGGHPFVTIKQNVVLRELYLGASEEQMRLIGEYELYRMKMMDVYIGVRGWLNAAEMSDVPTPLMQTVQRLWTEPVHLRHRVNFTRWVVTRFPTASMAQAAGMSTEGFEDFYFRVCTMDYARMAREATKLTKRLEQADRVRLLGPGTDLEFSVKNIPVMPCVGKRNLPDGEVYTAPVRDSVNGTITFNVPTLFNGVIFENVRLTFRDGKVVEAFAGPNTDRLNAILDSDEGARYVGEFAIGFNPLIVKPMNDTLFDEKICGSVHLTPGNAYAVADNGNRSQIHWDMVLIQRPEYGGGEIHLDGECIRKDGLFVPDDLQGLNPDALAG
ncbi:MAG: aminopeptidase [Armatimonadota bacterium]